LATWSTRIGWPGVSSPLMSIWRSSWSTASVSVGGLISCVVPTVIPVPKSFMI
jgi:hypothetical protein